MFKYSCIVRSNMNIELKRLDMASLQDREVMFQYESPGHYKVDIKETQDGWSISLKKENFPQPFQKRETELVITHYKGNSEIHGAFVEGREAGFIQFEHQAHNGSVRIWDIDVAPEFRRMGVGKALMDRCKARSGELGARRMVLETQTCNLKAIAFYRAMGFDLAGFDASFYQNNDIERGEVRLEMAFYP